FREMATFGNARTPMLAGMATLLAAGVPLALIVVRRPAAPAETAAIAAAYLVFGAAFLAMTRHPGEPLGAGRRIAFLIVQSVSALVLAAMIHSGFEGIFLVVVAAQLVFAVPARIALLWAAAQSLLFFAVQAAH